jgi:predicted transcriptional regulator
MDNKVKIQGNKIKVLQAYWDNDQMVVLMILLIIKYSIFGNSLSVSLKKVAFVLDAVKKNVTVYKLSILLASPWEISDELRKKIILAHEKQFISIKEVNSKVSFQLTTKGEAIVEQIEKLDLLPETRQEIVRLCKRVKSTELKNQHLIW